VYGLSLVPLTISPCSPSVYGSKTLSLVTAPRATADLASGLSLNLRTAVRATSMAELRVVPVLAARRAQPLRPAHTSRVQRVREVVPVVDHAVMLHVTTDKRIWPPSAALPAPQALQHFVATDGLDERRITAHDQLVPGARQPDVQPLTRPLVRLVLVER
jgi:hypothetical protein